MAEHIEIMPDKCKACRRCEVACIAAHNNMSFKEAMKNRDSMASRVQVIKEDGLKTSVRCHQCANAPCCNVCPTGALHQDSDGQISLNDSLCAACEMCIKACPYGTISMATVCDLAPAETVDGPACGLPGRYVAIKCDMCKSWRMENGKKITACMEACPVRALVLVEADGTRMEVPAPAKKAVPSNEAGTPSAAVS